MGNPLYMSEHTGDFNLKRALLLILLGAVCLTLVGSNLTVYASSNNDNDDNSDDSERSREQRDGGFSQGDDNGEQDARLY